MAREKRSEQLLSAISFLVIEISDQIGIQPLPYYTFVERLTVIQTCALLSTFCNLCNNFVDVSVKNMLFQLCLRTVMLYIHAVHACIYYNRWGRFHKIFMTYWWLGFTCMT